MTMRAGAARGGAPPAARGRVGQSGSDNSRVVPPTGMLKGVTGLSQRGIAKASSRSVDNPVRRRRLYGALGSGPLLAGALGYVGLVDPHHPDSLFPVCPFRMLTGWNCPLCGGLRMAHDVLHGDLAAAITDNVFLLVAIPILAGWILIRRRRGKVSLPMPAVVAVMIATLAWMVIRNLPGFPLVPVLLSG
jgi:Protein of unknown function (DUF2752)